MSARPWMPLYIADYLADTAHLDALESGAYLHLIMHYWRTGGLPDEPRQLAKIARVTPYIFQKICPVLRKFFHDGWRHKRIDLEIAKSCEISEKRRSAALAKRSVAPANAEQMQPQAQPQSLAAADADDADAIVRARASELTSQIYDIFGFDPKFIPPAWFGAHQWVEAGLRSGWKPDLVRLAVRKVAARKKGGPPNNFRYLGPAIAQEHELAAAPMPQGQTTGDANAPAQRNLTLLRPVTGGRTVAPSWQASRDAWRDARAELEDHVAGLGNGGDSEAVPPAAAAGRE